MAFDNKIVNNIRDLAQKGNFALAKSTLVKELKKNPQASELAAMKAYVQAKEGLRSQALATAAAITNFSSLRTVCILQETYDVCGEIGEMGVMFDRAFKTWSSSPSTVQLAVESQEVWYETMLENGNIRGLLQVFLVRQKLLGDRHSMLKTAFMYYMAVTNARETLSASESKLFPMLALKLVEKSEPLQNPQEYYLKGLVLSIQTNPDPFLAFLFDSDTKQKCTLLEMSIMRLEACKKNERYQLLYDDCKEYLTGVMDNYVHWTALIEAARKLDKVDEAREFIKSYQSGRNTKLALVALDNTCEAKERYFREMSSKKCAYGDLKEYLDVQESWVQDLKLDPSAKPKSLDQMISMVNIAKIKITEISVNDLVKLYMNTTHLLKGKDPKDYHAGDDYILLAVAKLLSSDTTVTESSILKCIILLELVAKNDSHQFYVRLWLVALYQQLGAYTNSLGHYNTLSIKNVQYESMGHFILSRSGSLYPEKINAFKDAESVYEEAGELFMVLITSFEESAYTKIEGVLELQKKLIRSLSKRILELEKNRVDRFSASNPSASVGLDVEFDVNDVCDNRDSKIMVNTLPDTYNTVFQQLNGPSNLCPQWIELELAREALLRYGIFNVNDKDTFDLLTQKAAHLEKLLKTHAQFVTPAEEWSYYMHLILVKILVNKESTTLYQEACDFLQNGLENLGSLTNWKEIHSGFIVLQTAQVVKGLCDRLKAAKQFKVNSKGIDQLLKHVKTITDQVAAKALASKNQRMQLFNTRVHELKPWVESLDISISLVEDVVDGIGASLDQTLTLLRKSRS